MKVDLGVQLDTGVFNSINSAKSDYDKDQFETFSHGQHIMMFIKYAFIESKVKGKHIFKIVDEPKRRPFVSDELRQRVIDSNLKGFKFELA